LSHRGQIKQFQSAKPQQGGRGTPAARGEASPGPNPATSDGWGTQTSKYAMRGGKGRARAVSITKEDRLQMMPIMGRGKFGGKGDGVSPRDPTPRLPVLTRTQRWRSSNLSKDQIKLWDNAFQNLYCVYKARVGDQGTWTRCSDAALAATKAGKTASGKTSRMICNKIEKTGLIEKLLRNNRPQNHRQHHDERCHRHA